LFEVQVACNVGGGDSIAVEAAADPRQSRDEPLRRFASVGFRRRGPNSVRTLQNSAVSPDGS
jgi:hypothetical protein